MERFKNQYGYANRMLYIDLGDMNIHVEETSQMVPFLIGARGLAAKICWDNYDSPVHPFASQSPLMIMTGPLTGSKSPYSGRTTICGFSPQAYPVNWFTRSSIGGNFGGELKRAGYDGIVISGISETPIRIMIKDDEVIIQSAEELWGKDIYDALETLQSIEGHKVHSLTIGQAGENLSHIATIHTATSSASGQCGFGAVMGSKRLKAISVIGTGKVALKHPKTTVSISKKLSAIYKKDNRTGITFFGRDLDTLNNKLAKLGLGKAFCKPCTESCITPCSTYFEDMPGSDKSKKLYGSMFCVAAVLFRGAGDDWPQQGKDKFAWKLPFEAAYEMNVISNRYGLNHYDLLMGIIPWLIACNKKGLINEFNGESIDFNSSEFWQHFLSAIAFRQGMGDFLSKGGWAAAKELDLGIDIAENYYAGWGQAGHWDGHDGGYYPFPFWLVSALQWMSDTRDPYAGGHGFLYSVLPLIDLTLMNNLEIRNNRVDQLKKISERVYGSPLTLDPMSGYRDKATAGHFHTIRPIIKDSISVDDFKLPLIYSESSADGFAILKDVEGIAGDIEGPSIEYNLFIAGTGVDYTENEFNLAAERISNLERAIQIRHWARNREMDEMVLPYFEKEEMFASFYLGQPQGLDRKKFKSVVDEFYELKGWNKKTGWPTKERLDTLGIGEIYDPMIAGAERVKEKVDK